MGWCVSVFFGSIISFGRDPVGFCHHLSFFGDRKVDGISQLPNIRMLQSLIFKQHIFLVKNQVSVYLIHPSLTHNVTTSSNQNPPDDSNRDQTWCIVGGHYFRLFKMVTRITRWWFQISFIFTPNPGFHDPFLTCNIFQRGCFNHPTRQPIPKKGSRLRKNPPGKRRRRRQIFVAKEKWIDRGQSLLFDHFGRFLEEPLRWESDQCSNGKVQWWFCWDEWVVLEKKERWGSLNGMWSIIFWDHKLNCIDLTPPISPKRWLFGREVPLFQGNLGWWNIVIWPERS